MNIDELIKIIGRSRQHRHLYHFTDEANFPSIRQKGLVSKARMRQEGWWPPLATGGNELSHSLDTHRGIDGDVSLCFTRDHPMMYLARKDGRLPNPRYLAIHPAVLKIEGVRISFGVANSTDVEVMPIAAALDKLDVEVIYKYTDWFDQEVQSRLQLAKKFEILVPDAVPRKLIVGVF